MSKNVSLRLSRVTRARRPVDPLLSCYVVPLVREHRAPETAFRRAPVPLRYAVPFSTILGESVQSKAFSRFFSFFYLRLLLSVRRLLCGLMLPAAVKKGCFMAFNLFNTALSWLGQFGSSWYDPIAGYYDSTAVDSPSYSPVNFIGDYYAPNNPIMGNNGNSLVNFGTKDNPQAPTAPAVSNAPVAPSTIDYWNAEIAKHYGMSPETAYQEALSNTSYQRAIKDMQAAGLNPAAMFGSGNGSGANGVSYVSRAGSSGSGSTTARSNDKNLFSEGAYYGLSTMIGLVTALLMKSPTGYWIGNSAAQGALGAANAGYKSRNR